MSLRIPRILLLIAVLLALPAFAASAPSNSTQSKPDAAKGRIYAQTCAFCHGITDYTTAYPFYHVPRVAGQHQTYIIDALKEYASNARKYPTMHAQAASLTTSQIRDIAAYFASVGKPVKHHPKSKPPAVAKTCAACHGAHGISKNPKYPILAGQYPNYIVQALKEYKSGKRKNAIMNSMAANLTPAQMEKLAQYFGRQPTPLREVPVPGVH